MSRVCDIINNKYFNWMCELICDERYPMMKSHQQLLHHLHNREFTYTIEFDSNRAEDGVYLRYRYVCEHHNHNASVVQECLDGPCSVLEMLIALALRCEEDMMDDIDQGNRTGKWFWNMISNLGLMSMDDTRFSTRRVDAIVDRFLNREYEPDGKGGLFTIPNSRHDLRTVEIWHQMCWYLNDI